MQNRFYYIFMLWGMSLLLASCSVSRPDSYLPLDQRLRFAEKKLWHKNEFIVIAYHDVEDEDPDQSYLSVSTEHLRQQFSWLQENNYVPVSIEQIIAAQQAGSTLPERAVVLSFDDGYRSFYTRVYPLLKAYNWPAVLAPVGKWLDAPSDQLVDFGGQLTERERFLTWQQVQEMSQSGLVEIGAHTQNMHFGVQANPQGNMQPIAAAHQFFPELQRYETDAEFQARFRNDVRAISSRIQHYTGKKPRVWVWPYGRASGLGLEVLKQEGYLMAMTLQGGMATVDELMSIPRYLVDNDPSIETFATFITAREDIDANRVVHVDLDYVYDPDPIQMERNLDELVQRIADLKPRSVFLQAFADPLGDGLVRSVYFPNRHLPMRADLFNRAAWQLHSRAHVDVYAWMPVLAVHTDAAIDRVERWHPDGTAPTVSTQTYPRLSPFDPRARQLLGELYEDLGRSGLFYGVLFHDDAILSDYEDASSSALAAYEKAGFGRDIGAIRADPKRMHAWTRFKSKALVDLTLELAQRVKSQHGPQIVTARNMYAMVVLQPESEEWFAQNLQDFLTAYDWTAVMAMPLMEKVESQKEIAWLEDLVSEVNRNPSGIERTIFEVQTVDWSKKNAEAQPIASKKIAEWLNALSAQGARHVGYYPDDFFNNHPEMKVIRPEITTHWYPVEP